MPRLVVLSPIIAGAFGPPKDSAVAASTNDMSGPDIPMSKFKVPDVDLSVGVADSTKNFKVPADPIDIPVSATVNEFSVPRDTKLDCVTVEFSVLPVRVAAAAGTVIFVVPSKITPLICLGVANCVAELALPVKVAPTKTVATTVSKLLVPEAAVTLPVTLPTRSAVIVPAANPPELFLATTLPI